METKTKNEMCNNQSHNRKANQWICHAALWECRWWCLLIQFNEFTRKTVIIHLANSRTLFSNRRVLTISRSRSPLIRWCLRLSRMWFILWRFGSAVYLFFFSFSFSFNSLALLFIVVVVFVVIVILFLFFRFFEISFDIAKCAAIKTVHLSVDKFILHHPYMLTALNRASDTEWENDRILVVYDTRILKAFSECVDGCDYRDNNATDWKGAGRWDPFCLFLCIIYKRFSRSLISRALWLHYSS